MLPLLYLGLWQHSWAASSVWDAERCHVAWGLLCHWAILKADPLPAMFPPVSHPLPQPASLPPLPVSLPAVPGIYNTYYPPPALSQPSSPIPFCLFDLLIPTTSV